MGPRNYAQVRLVRSIQAWLSGFLDTAPVQEVLLLEASSSRFPHVVPGKARREVPGTPNGHKVHL